MALGRTGRGAAAACTAAVAAVLALSALAAPGPADAASHLAGMRLDGLAAGGHAIVLEFAASGEEGRAAGGAAGGEGRPGMLVLDGGLVRTGEGPRALGGPDARVMVTGGGTVVVYSADSPAVVLAVPERSGSGGGGEDAGRYTVTAYVPRGGGGNGGGGFETVSFDATLGPRSGSPDAPAPDPAAAAPPPDDAGKGSDEPGRFPDDLAVAMTITERVQFGGTLVVQGRVYDVALNDRPAVVPIGPGAVPGVPVQVTVTDRRTGEDILDQDGEADESGLFRAEYRWKNTDPAATLDISVSIDGGRALEKRTAFYLGDAGSRGSRSD